MKNYDSELMTDTIRYIMSNISNIADRFVSIINGKYDDRYITIDDEVYNLSIISDSIDEIEHKLGNLFESWEPCHNTIPSMQWMIDRMANSVESVNTIVKNLPLESDKLWSQTYPEITIMANSIVRLYYKAIFLYDSMINGVDNQDSYVIP